MKKYLIALLVLASQNCFASSTPSRRENQCTRLLATLNTGIELHGLGMKFALQMKQGLGDKTEYEKLLPMIGTANELIGGVFKKVEILHTKLDQLSDKEKILLTAISNYLNAFKVYSDHLKTAYDLPNLNAASLGIEGYLARLGNQSVEPDKYIHRMHLRSVEYIILAASSLNNFLEGYLDYNIDHFLAARAEVQLQRSVSELMAYQNYSNLQIRLIMDQFKDFGITDEKLSEIFETAVQLNQFAYFLARAAQGVHRALFHLEFTPE